MNVKFGDPDTVPTAFVALEKLLAGESAKSPIIARPPSVSLAPLIPVIVIVKLSVVELG
jgi:hypothetical protein